MEDEDGAARPSALQGPRELSPALVKLLDAAGEARESNDGRKKNINHSVNYMFIKKKGLGQQQKEGRRADVLGAVRCKARDWEARRPRLTGITHGTQRILVAEM